MKRLLVTIAAIAGLAGTARAADAVDGCAETWTGLYVGAHVGYQVADTTTDGVAGDPVLEGIVGGGLAGYNMQFCQYVVGVEADFGISDVDDSNGAVRDFDLDFQAHGRVRAGWVWDESVMPFLAAGIALGDMDVNVPGTGSDSNTHIGFSIGGGLDAMVSEHVVLRAEYLFDTYESINYAIGGGVDVDADGHTVRGAVIWNF